MHAIQVDDQHWNLFGTHLLSLFYAAFVSIRSSGERHEISYNLPRLLRNNGSICFCILNVPFEFPLLL